MGLGHAAYLVQRLHEFIVSKIPGLGRCPLAREWGLSREDLLSPALVAVIVDDLNVFHFLGLAGALGLLAGVEEIYEPDFVVRLQAETP